MGAKNHKHPECLNCGFSFTSIEHDNFCPKCGQKNTDRKYAFGELIWDFFTVAFNFDFKYLKSITGFLFKPGKLTNQVLAGKRKSNPQPFRLFVILSFLTFFLLSYTSDKLSLGENFVTVDLEEGEILNDSLFYCLVADNYAESLAKKDTITPFNNAIYYTVVDNTAPQKAIEIAGMECSGFDILCWIRKESVSIFHHRHKEFSLNPFGIAQKATNYLIGNMGVTILATIPLLALILKLLYLRRKFILVEHTIFAINYWNALFIILILLQLYALLISNSYWQPLIFWLCTFVLMFANLKMVYKQGYTKTFFKTLFAHISYFMLTLVILLIGFTLSMYMVMRV